MILKHHSTVNQSVLKETSMFSILIVHDCAN